MLLIGFTRQATAGLDVKYVDRTYHVEPAGQGVPALHVFHPGAERRNRPADCGRRMGERCTRLDDHQVADEVKADWDLGGVVEDAPLLFRVGLAVAQGSAYLEWKPGTEFRAVRAARLKGT